MGRARLDLYATKKTTKETLALRRPHVRICSTPSSEGVQESSTRRIRRRPDEEPRDWVAWSALTDLRQLEIRSYCFDETIRAEEAAWHYNTISLWNLVRSQAGSRFLPVRDTTTARWQRVLPDCNPRTPPENAQISPRARRRPLYVNTKSRNFVQSQ